MSDSEDEYEYQKRLKLDEQRRKQRWLDEHSFDPDDDPEHWIQEK